MSAPKSTITEDLSPFIDGLTDTFSVSGGPFIAGTLEVEYNGVRGRAVSDGGEDFEELSTTSFRVDPVPLVGDSIKVQYEIEDLGAGFPLVVASGRDC